MTFRYRKMTVISMSLYSEDTQPRERISYCWRYAVIRQVQVTETLHESVWRVAVLFRWRLQSLVTQVLPAFQPDRV